MPRCACPYTDRSRASRGGPRTLKGTFSQPGPSVFFLCFLWRGETPASEGLLGASLSTPHPAVVPKAAGLGLPSSWLFRFLFTSLRTALRMFFQGPFSFSHHPGHLLPSRPACLPGWVELPSPLARMETSRGPTSAFCSSPVTPPPFGPPFRIGGSVVGVVVVLVTERGIWESERTIPLR